PAVDRRDEGLVDPPRIDAQRARRILAEPGPSVARATARLRRRVLVDGVGCAGPGEDVERSRATGCHGIDATGASIGYARDDPRSHRVVWTTSEGGEQETPRSASPPAGRGGDH